MHSVFWWRFPGQTAERTSIDNSVITNCSTVSRKIDPSPDSRKIAVYAVVLTDIHAFEKNFRPD
jgi:hypothetical protein